MRRLIVFFSSFSLIALMACGSSQRAVQASVADGIAQGANAGFPVLIQAYREQGDTVIDAAQTRKAAEEGLDDVRARWAPVWKAWQTFRAAHGAWADALEGGGDTTAALGALKKAYCEVEAVWPSELAALPSVPITCPERP